ncbi:hypothetical protein JTB14_001537 [Gonioctena quinquepunctata]|nr:hypothetical protein JTB14_001537 [Gonioctena quinquepunctata]
MRFVSIQISPSVESFTNLLTCCLKYLKNVTDIDNNKIICCETPQSDKCASESDILHDASDIQDKKVDMQIFNFILNLKDIIINELREKIDLLNEHIELITENNIPKQNKPVSLSTQEETPNTSKKANPPANENKGNSPIIKRNDVSAALLHEKTSLKLTEYINLNKEIPRNLQTPDDPTSSKFDWKQAVGRRNRNRRQMITGNNKETVAVKGVPKHVTLHVCRVDKETRLHLSQRYSMRIFRKQHEEAFNLMDDDNLKELIPNMEKRLKFKKEFTEYLLSRENIQCYPVDESNTSNDDSIVPELERQRL